MSTHTITDPDPVTAADTIAADVTNAAKQAAYRIHNILREHPDGATVSLRAEGDDDLTVPREAAELLRRILTSMAAGKPVTIVPRNAELTTQQAAELIGVSRPYLIGLLARGEIEHRMVGTHRRILAASLRTYADQAGRDQREAADELTALSLELGI